MCVVCKLEDLDWRFRNGPDKSDIFKLNLYCFYEEKVAQLALCYCHSYELFLIGERKFVIRHPKLVQEMVANKNNYILRAPAHF